MVSITEGTSRWYLVDNCIGGILMETKVKQLHANNFLALKIIHNSMSLKRKTKKNITFTQTLVELQSNSMHSNGSTIYVVTDRS